MPMSKPSSSKRSRARFLGRVLAGAKPSSEMPRFVRSVAPALVEQVPTGNEWVHEIKFDGYRMQVRLDGDEVAMSSRAELDWTHRFPQIVRAFRELPANHLLMDGEVISATDEGGADFGQLQADLKNGRHDRLVYFAFDLMFLDGFDLTQASLIERKRVLKAFLDEASSERIFYSEHFKDGSELFAKACQLGLEGIVSKRATSTYKPSRTNWQKVKCEQTDELVIVGYVPQGKTHIAALRLGKKNGKAFDYVGKVGTGFTSDTSHRLRKQLDALIVSKPSLTAPIRKPDTKWVKPLLTARVAFRGITGEGKLRHPSFKGLA